MGGGLSWADAAAEIAGEDPLVDMTVVLESVPVEAKVVRLRGLTQQLACEAYTASAQFVFPLHGVHYLNEGGREVLIDLNQIGVIPADRTTRERHPTTGDVTSLVVTPSPDLLSEALWGAENARSILGEESACSAVRSSPFAQRVAHRLGVRQASDAADSLELAIELMREAGGARPAVAAVGRRPLRLVNAVKEMIATAARPLPLERFAAELHASPAYLTDLFRRVEGVPIHKYQMRLRLARGLRLLSTSDDLADLALELGFSSHSHFSCAFRAAYGMPPSIFRESVRGRSPPAPSSRRAHAYAARLEA